MKDKFVCCILASVHLKQNTILSLIIAKDVENVKLNSVCKSERHINCQHTDF
jgi:ribosomal protein L25 (general stress protein Ctc)